MHLYRITLYSHHCETNLWNVFILQNWNLVPIKQELPFLPSLILVTTILPSLSVNLTILLAGFKWNHSIWKKSYDQPRHHIKSRDITLPTKVHLVKAMVSLVVMYGCESWTIKKVEQQRTDAFELCVVLEKTLESPLDCKDIQPVHPKGNQSWIFIIAIVCR